MDPRDALRPWRDGLVLWEWRTFGALPRDAIGKIRTLPLVRIERLDDEYIRLPRRLDASIKLRAGGLKLKRLTGSEDGIDAWVHLELDFPVRFETLAALLDLEGLSAADGTCATGRELAAALGGRASLVGITKERRCYRVRSGRAGCEVETAHVTLGGSRSLTAAVTGGDADTVRVVVGALGMDGCQPVDYPRFIEEAVGRLHREEHDADGE